MILHALQHRLQSLYELETDYRVQDYLITDAALAGRYGKPASVLESLFVVQEADALDIALYIDAAVLDALDQSDPFTGLRAETLNAFLIALEGVSHFLYVVWNAGYDKPVTPLELELQAEVDKFVVLAGILDDLDDRQHANRLLESIFDGAVFNPSLDQPLLARYRDANQLAGRYCRHLNSRFDVGSGTPDLMVELRRFYRLTRNDKLRRISTCH